MNREAPGSSPGGSFGTAVVPRGNVNGYSGRHTRRTMFDDPTDPAGPGNDSDPREQLQDLMAQAESLGANVHAMGFDASAVPFEPDEPQEAFDWANERVTLEVTAPRHALATWAAMLGTLVTEHGDVDETHWYARKMIQQWSDAVQTDSVGVALQLAMHGLDDMSEWPDPDEFEVDAHEHEPRNDDATIEVTEPEDGEDDA